MRIARLLFVTLGAATALAARAEAQTRPLPSVRDDQARLRAAVEASAARASQAWNRGDIDGFIHAFAPTVWVFPPNAQPFQGTGPADDYFTRGYSEGTRNLQLQTTGLERSGALAYETGTYTADYPTPGQGGAMSRDYGKYVHVWKREPDGAWRIHLVAWSSNLPPGPTLRPTPR